ncbi:hypothetical protein ASPWEDRAFT_292279 [Aspergillus wentii DTO 134E9]|uniref:Uncharacterized protein n=1 Tax=Aspergillus wentii DTO 134E9 TaxID=1073089 RepID=A0A1L9S401_ASPWE|nr:uncharacterized protein ASPWEDRAFT_292279 [Aspergillus wentii DTO 134E9]OJJ41890.1 hypothetical protein ASPWEDRAFT_292279 [Aspergillus wentii DTO 134E9]
MWDVGSKVDITQYQEVSRRIAVFRIWFTNKYMHTDSRPSIFILPISEVAPNYRDVYPGVPKEPSTGLRTTYLSPALGAPELAIPIGQLPYQSRITRKTESLPVLAALMSPPGSDLDLVRIALEYLEKIPLPTKVHTGKLMFSGIASVSEGPLPL